jgi:hypothetical protein
VRSRWERGFAIGLAALLLVLALLAQFLQSPPGSVAGSVASSKPDGRRALALLLRESGFRAEPWNDAPASLPRDGTLLWLAKPPSRAGAKTSSKEPAEPSPAEEGLRSPEHYRRFVESGGTLLLPRSDAAREFLVDALGFTACGEAKPVPEPHAGVRAVRSERGESIEVDLHRGTLFSPPDEGSTVRPLWSATEGPLVVEVPEARGKVVLVGDDSFLDNEHLGDRDAALLAVRLAEQFAPGKQVLFDEYALGLWAPRTPIGILVSPGFFLATLHLLLLLALLVLRSAWVREFPRDPATLESASPLLRARSLAALLERAGRSRLLGRWLEEGKARARGAG